MSNHRLKLLLLHLRPQAKEFLNTVEIAFNNLPTGANLINMEFPQFCKWPIPNKVATDFCIDFTINDINSAMHPITGLGFGFLIWVGTIGIG